MKLYFGNAITTATTLMLLALLGFIGWSVVNRSDIQYWGRRSVAVQKIATMEIARIISGDPLFRINFYAIRKFRWNPLFHKNIIALGAVVDGCQGNRASAKECANGTFFLMKKQAAIVLKIGRKEGLLIKR